MKKQPKKGLEAKSGYFRCFFMISQATDMLEQKIQQIWILHIQLVLMIPILHIFMTKKLLCPKGGPFDFPACPDAKATAKTQYFELKF